MPARRLINLLPQDPFTASFIGKFVLFSITIGRYVVVFTELVVIIAFLSRFFLDRQIGDLNDRIRQQTAVINTSKEFELNFRFIQMRLLSANKLMDLQFKANDFLDKATPLVSPDITLTRLSIQDGILQLSGTSATTSGLRQTISAFQNSGWLTSISLTSVASSESSGGGLKFSLTATVLASNLKKGGS